MQESIKGDLAAMATNTGKYKGRFGSYAQKVRDVLQRAVYINTVLVSYGLA